MSTARITAIIPLWNREQLLESLLDSLARQTLPPAEILVVDNGSDDGAPELARRRGARVIPMGSQRRLRRRRESRHRGGFAANGSPVLNTDVALAPDYFAKLAAARRLVRHRQDSAAAAIPPASTPLSICSPARRRPGAPATARPYGPAFRQARAIWSAPWTAVLFRAEMFHAWGCWKTVSSRTWKTWISACAAAALGFAGEYVPEAVAWHRGQRLAGPLASRSGAAHRPQPDISAGAALSAAPAACAGFGRFWLASCFGVWWRCGTEPAWRGCAAKMRRDCGVFAPLRARSSHSRRNYWQTSSGRMSG